MKVHILLITAVMLLIPQVFADQMYDYGIQKSFYIKVFAGADKLNLFKRDGSLDVVSPDKMYDVKFKSNYAPFIGGSIGYYFTDKIRADLTLDCLINQHFSISLSDSKIIPKSNPLNGITDFTIKETKSAKFRAAIPTLLANAYVNIIEIWPVKFFAGAGIGVARLKYNANYTDVYSITPGDLNVVKANAAAIQASLGNNYKVDPATGYISDYIKSTKIFKSKEKYRFAYSLMLGVSTEIKPGINTELVYSWKDCGEINDIVYKGHNVSVGIRFDI